MPTNDSRQVGLDAYGVNKLRYSQGPDERAGRGPTAAGWHSENVTLLRRSPGITVLAFAGIAEAFGGMPPFNFVRAIGDTSTNVIFVRDPNSKWFGNSITGLGANLQHADRKDGAAHRELRAWQVNQPIFDVTRNRQNVMPTETQQVVADLFPLVRELSKKLDLAGWTNDFPLR